MILSEQRIIVIVARLALLGFGVYLICKDRMVLGTLWLLATFPLWEALHCELPPLRPNWRKPKRGNRYNRSHHTFTLTFAIPADAKPAEVYDRLKNFDDFNGGANEIARKRSRMIGRVRYIYFDNLGFHGVMSTAINPPSMPVRIWSRKSDCLVIADTANGHPLNGQRRWQATPIGARDIQVSTEAYEHPRNLANRLGMRVVGSGLQRTIWLSYFENMKSYFTGRATSSAVAVAPVTQVSIPASAPPALDWAPTEPYPGVEVP